ncbi:MAG: STAS domain-containing protein [Acidimicrobiales bacterium]
MLRTGSTQGFELRIWADGGNATVGLLGELDMVTIPTYEEGLKRLYDEGTRQVTLDLEGLTFIDSSGLSALVASLRLFRGAGGDVVLRSPTRATAKVLEICGLTQVFTIEGQDDRTENGQGPSQA